jgi:hypothetical protein
MERDALVIDGPGSDVLVSWLVGTARRMRDPVPEGSGVDAASEGPRLGEALGAFVAGRLRERRPEDADLLLAFALVGLDEALYQAYDELTGLESQRDA